MDLEQQYIARTEVHLWEDNQQPNLHQKGKYRKSFKRWGHVACLYGQYMFIFGGEVDTNIAEATNNIFKISLEDILNNSWAIVDSNSRKRDIVGRDSLTAVKYKNSWFLMFGQLVGQSTSEILEYNFTASTLSKVKLKADPIPREAHASALIHNRFMINYGGVTVVKRRGQDTDYGHKLSIWDLETNTFTDVPDTVILNANVIKQRKCHTIVEVNNQLCVFGGSTLNSVNRTNPDDLLSDMFVIQIAFFQYVDRSVKIDDPMFVHVSGSIYAKFALAPVNYQGPKVQLHSHNANVIGNDLVVYTCGEVVIRDEDRFRVVCNTHVYGYSISSNQMFEITQLRNKIPKRICATSVGYSNALFIYGGYNNKKKSLNSISILTFEMSDKVVFVRPYSVHGRSARDMTPEEETEKRLNYAMNAKSGVNSTYANRLFEKNDMRDKSK